MEKIIDNLKKLKKADLVDMLEFRVDNINQKATKDQLVETLNDLCLDVDKTSSFLLFLTTTEFEYLVKGYNDGCISLEEIADPFVIQTLLKTGYFYEGKDKIVLIDEAKKVLIHFIETDYVELRNKKHWIIECIDCADILYVNYDINNLLSLIKQEPLYKDITSNEVISYVKELPNNIIGFEFFENNLVFSSTLYDDKKKKYILEEQQGKNFKVINIEAIHTLFSYDIILNSNSIELITALNEHLQDEALATQLMTKLCKVSLYGFELNDYLKELIEILSGKLSGPNETDKLNSIISLVNECYNNTPTVFNRGASPSDLFKLEKPFLKTPKTVKTLVNTNKVGRNDPCPCGSGKKYKKCCGLRLDTDLVS